MASQVLSIGASLIIKCKWHFTDSQNVNFNCKMRLKQFANSFHLENAALRMNDFFVCFIVIVDVVVSRNLSNKFRKNNATWSSSSSAYCAEQSRKVIHKQKLHSQFRLYRWQTQMSCAFDTIKQNGTGNGSGTFTWLQNCNYLTKYDEIVPHLLLFHLHLLQFLVRFTVTRAFSILAATQRAQIYCET